MMQKYGLSCRPIMSKETKMLKQLRIKTRIHLKF